MLPAYLFSITKHTLSYDTCINVYQLYLYVYCYGIIYYVRNIKVFSCWMQELNSRYRNSYNEYLNMLLQFAIFQYTVLQYNI